MGYEFGIGVFGMYLLGWGQDFQNPTLQMDRTVHTGGAIVQVNNGPRCPYMISIRKSMALMVHPIHSGLIPAILR